MPPTPNIPAPQLQGIARRHLHAWSFYYGPSTAIYDEVDPDPATHPDWSDVISLRVQSVDEPEPWPYPCSNIVGSAWAVDVTAEVIREAGAGAETFRVLIDPEGAAYDVVAA